MKSNDITFEKLDYYVYDYHKEIERLNALRRELIDLEDKLSIQIESVKDTIEFLKLVDKTNRKNKITINWIEFLDFEQYEYRYGYKDSNKLYEVQTINKEHILLADEDRDLLLDSIVKTQEKNLNVLQDIKARFMQLEGLLENLNRKGSVIFIAQKFVAYGLTMPAQLSEKVETIFEEFANKKNRPNLKYQDEMYQLFEKMIKTDRIKTRVAAFDVLKAFNFIATDDEKETEKIDSFIRQYYNRVDKL